MWVPPPFIRSCLPALFRRHSCRLPVNRNIPDDINEILCEIKKKKSFLPRTDESSTWNTGNRFKCTTFRFFPLFITIVIVEINVTSRNKPRVIYTVYLFLCAPPASEKGLKCLFRIIRSRERRVVKKPK